MNIFWHDLIFILPIAMAIVLGAGAVTGLLGDADVDVDIDVDVDVDVDVDADADGDADGEHEGGFSLLAAMGVGKAPMSVLLSSAMLSFGATGLATEVLVGPWFALAIALVVTPLATAAVGRTLARFLPSSETYATRRSDLVGCQGVARVRVSDSFGVAQVHDDRGDLHEVRCRADEAIRPGEPLVVVDWDAESGVFEVASMEDPAKALLALEGSA